MNKNGYETTIASIDIKSPCGFIEMQYAQSKGNEFNKSNYEFFISTIGDEKFLVNGIETNKLQITFKGTWQLFDFMLCMEEIDYKIVEK